MNQCKYKFDTILMNSENRTTFHPHRLLLDLTHKIDLQRGKKVLHYQILGSTTYGKNKKLI